MSDVCLMCMYALEIQCSEIASEAILGQKKSIASNFWLSIYAFAKPVDIE